MSQENEESVAVKEVQRALDILREHFDSVLILASRNDDHGATNFCFKGSGNQFARVGMARQYLLRDEAVVKYDSEKDAIAEDDAQE